MRTYSCLFIGNDHVYIAVIYRDRIPRDNTTYATARATTRSFERRVGNDSATTLCHDKVALDEPSLS